jgi:hypothetical protein
MRTGAIWTWSLLSLLGSGGGIEMFGTGLLRKATKVVVYTAIPIAGPLKAATMGTRNGNLSRKELKKQSKLMEEQNRLLREGR